MSHCTKFGRHEITRNVGSWERVLRIVIGVILLALVVSGPKTWWGLVGVIPLGTALWGMVTRLVGVGFSTHKG